MEDVKALLTIILYIAIKVGVLFLIVVAINAAAVIIKERKGKGYGTIKKH